MGVAAHRILVVEDEAIIAMDLAQQLEGFGYAVAGVAHTADEAVAQARVLDPDLVLMDIVLRGDADGIAAARRIGAEQSVPIVYLTAYSDVATVGRAAATAPYGYLTKPFESRQVRAVIEVALAKAAVERDLQESRRWLEAILRSVSEGVVATDVEARIRLINPMAQTLLGPPRAEPEGRHVAEVVRFGLATNGPLPEHPVLRALRRGERTPVAFGNQLLRDDGARLPVDESAAPIRHSDGALAGAVLVFRDVSGRIRLEEDLRASEQRFYAAFMNAASGVAVVAIDDRLTLANPAFARMVGRDAEALVGCRYLDLLHPDSRAGEVTARERMLAGEAREFQTETRHLDATGLPVWTLVSCALVQDGEGRPQAYVYHVLDIDERKRAEARLQWLAHYDPLTGLANRAHLQFEAGRSLAAARRSGEHLGLLFLDLDNFKRVNDTLGHDVGDVLLREIGDRLRQAARSSDLVARMGGDEFVILVGDVARPQAAATIAAKLREAVARPLMLEGHEVTVTASVGVSLFPEDGEEIGTLLRNADAALYVAKGEGRDAVAFYREELTARTGERMRLDSALHRALEAREFVLHYQPLVDLRTGAVTGVEALLRWRHDGRTVSPAEFVPALEETGLIVPVGIWVVREACRQRSAWQAGGGPELLVSVNVSPRQLRDAAFPADVRAALADAGLPGEALCLEITETFLAAITETESAALDALAAAGIALAIDDFGTGYSSLGYLKRFRPRSLKIDRSFVTGVGIDPSDSAIVSATIAMARRLGLRVVAEGVETEQQYAFLEAEGCDAVQGYLLSRPVPADDIPALARRRPAGD